MIFLDKIHRANEIFLKFCAIFLLFGIFLLLIAQIFARQILNTPLIFSEELSLLGFVWMGAIGAVLAIYSHEHVFIDFFVNILNSFFSKFSRKNPKKPLEIFVNSVIFICICALFFFGVHVFNESNFEIISLEISEKWLYAALPVTSALMFLAFLRGKSPRAVAIFCIIFGIFAVMAFLPPEILNARALAPRTPNAIFITIIIWLFIMFIGVPVGFSLIFSAIFYFCISDLKIAFQASFKLIDSLNSFPILAIPFFVMTGLLMNTSGVTLRIFNFAKALLGHFRGGLGHVNVGASVMFSGISGSALADAMGLGQFEIKAMRDAGYDDDIATGLTAASCIIGPLVPPSIAMIIYGSIANVSIAKLFLAGFVPAFLVAIALMAMNFYICKRRNYPLEPRATKRQILNAFKKSFFALMTPVIIIGGIFSGIFTPTEAAIIAVLYCLVISAFVYRELDFRALLRVGVETVVMTGVVALMIEGVSFFGSVIAYEQLAARITEAFIVMADSKIQLLFMINLLLLFLGMFIDALALQFLVLPLLIPLAIHFQVDLVFFGIMTLLNMMIGILTPPMGMALFVVARVGNVPVSVVTRGVFPFLLPILLVLIFITIFPGFVTFLPDALIK